MTRAITTWRVSWRWMSCLILSGMLALTACGRETAKLPEVRPVKTVVVDPMPIDDDKQAVGEVRPRQETDFGFRVAGKVVSRPVDVGVTVAKGGVLARLDEQDFVNRVRSAEADVESAVAVLNEARGSEGRLKQLLGTGATTRANYDAALRNLRSSDAKLQAAQAALALAKDQLKYAELKADFAGIATAVGVEPGQVVGVGQMVVRLAVPDEKDAVFAIAETAFRGRKPGDRPEIAVTLLSDPSVSANGVVREISPVADPTTRTFQVKVALKDAPPQMRFGSSVLGRLRATTAPVVVLPAAALFQKGDKPAVWVLEPDKVSVVLRPVVVARYESNRVVVADGLVKGDIVVTAGVNRLREGQHVRQAEARP